MNTPENGMQTGPLNHGAGVDALQERSSRATGGPLFGLRDSGATQQRVPRVSAGISSRRQIFENSCGAASLLVIAKELGVEKMPAFRGALSSAGDGKLALNSASEHDLFMITSGMTTHRRHANSVFNAGYSMRPLAVTIGGDPGRAPLGCASHRRSLHGPGDGQECGDFRRNAAKHARRKHFVCRIPGYRNIARLPSGRCEVKWSPLPLLDRNAHQLCRR